MAKWIRLAVMVTVAVAIVVVIGWSFVPTPVGVDTAPVTAGGFEATVDVDGVTRVQESYVVSAPFAASLHRLELHAGGAVDVGAVVARLSPIDPPLLDARSAAARHRALPRIRGQRTPRARRGITRGPRQSLHRTRI